MEEAAGLTAWALENVPEAMRADSIWRLPSSHYALYLGDLLLDAAQSISSNITEG